MFRPWSKFARLLVTAVLLFPVACSELPELATLSDNTSNDFTTQSYAAAAEVTIAAVTFGPAKAPASLMVRREESVNVRQRASSPHISRDLFLLYSTFRT